MVRWGLAASVSKSASVYPKVKRKPIPKAVREQIWLRDFGKTFEAKCSTVWCKNTINVWDFHAGHNVPDSKGGMPDAANLVPICSRCNLSMSDNYTFHEWSTGSGKPVVTAKAQRPWWCPWPFAKKSPRP